MPSEPVPGPVRRAVSSLDHRIEAVTGHDIDTLWAHRDSGLLDEAHAELVDRHRELAEAERGVTFHRTLLHRLSSGEFPVDGALFVRIDRTVDQLERAADTRDTLTQRVLVALAPVEAAARTASGDTSEALSTTDQAALLAIAGGARLHEHLLTSRLSVTTASGARIPYASFQRLEAAGLVALDTSHPVHAGQPVTLTDAGRAALTARRRPQPNPAPTPGPRPGAWPARPAPRR
ncbi:hypothetical protein [Streptomyces sp. NPDC090994]|uniref:hypothetical protein n=1 Tax=Streptomyces sp. NPDC090994 TaxID=3365969 RepID=UPI00382AA47A